MRTLLLTLSLSLLVGCEDAKPYVDPDTVHFDAAPDYSLGAQVTHIGPTAVTCCIVSNGSSVMYLVKPVPGRVDSHGFQKAAVGELHLADPFGADFVLAPKVPVFGYGYSPDGQTAMWIAGTASSDYSLQMTRVASPALLQPDVKTVIPSGLDDSGPLAAQSIFTPSGHYMVVGAKAPGTMGSPDLHVVDVGGARDVYQLPNGAFAYQETFTADDTMIFENGTPSTSPGQPAVEGLYIVNLPAAAGGAHPALIDTHTGNLSLTADGTTLVYQRLNGDLVLWDLADNDYQTLATNVLTFSLGPGRKGPIVYVGQDLSVHVTPKQRPEVASTPPNSIDINSPLVFSPDHAHLYFFQHVDLEDNHGDLFEMALPPTGDGKMQLVSQRASLADFYFTSDRLVFLRNVNTTGDTGDMISVRYDGTDPQPMNTGVATGEVQVGYPQLPPEAPPRRASNYPPLDLALPPPPPVFANLSNATRQTGSNIKFVNDALRPVVGSLAYGPILGAPEVVLDTTVHSGTYEFSDDGFVLVYIGNAKYQSSAYNYVGTLQLFQTIANIGPAVPMLDGVAELGPIVQRSMFVSAPAAPTPGMYFVKY